MMESIEQMGAISKIKLKNVSYDIKDATATSDIASIKQDILDIKDTYVTVDDEELEASIPINADTLDGYHASYFSGLVSTETTRAKAAEDTKVDKVSGKGLSANDFVDAYKTKLENIETQATRVVITTDSDSNVVITYNE